MWCRSIVILFFACSIAVSAMAAEVLPPRMWKAVSTPNAEGTVTTIYLAGITHIGLSLEFDDYFFKKMLPAFQSSDDFSFEGAGGREMEQKPPCDVSVLDAPSREILAETRSKVFDDVMAVHEMVHDKMEKEGVHDGTKKEIRARIWRNYVDNLDEYDLITFGITYAQARETSFPHPVIPAAANHDFMNSNVVGYLRSVRPQLAIRDLDSHYGLRRAYCNTGAARIQFLQRELHLINTNSEKSAEMGPLVKAETFNILAGLPDESRFSSLSMSDLDKTFICQRNSEWIGDMKNLRYGKRHFIAVGIKHLYKVDHDDAHCRGLLDDLRDQGWQVDVVK